MTEQELTHLDQAHWDVVGNRVFNYCIMVKPPTPTFLNVLLFLLSNKPTQRVPFEGFSMPTVSTSPKDRKCFLFPDPLVRGGSVLGASTPSRNDQDRKHVVVGDSNSNPFDQTPKWTTKTHNASVHSPCNNNNNNQKQTKWACQSVKLLLLKYQTNQTSELFFRQGNFTRIYSQWNPFLEPLF